MIAVALGAYEYVTGQVLWNRGLLDTASLSDVVRVNSLFFDPNIYGRFLMVVLLGSWPRWPGRAGSTGRRARGHRRGPLARAARLLLAVLDARAVVGTLVLIGVRFGTRPAILATGGWHSRRSSPWWRSQACCDWISPPQRALIAALLGAGRS